MGGLRKLMPKTWWAMLIGGLALAGIPPLSGFFSKDSILASALDRGGTATSCSRSGSPATFLTGLYTFRMLFIVFGGEQSAYVREHPPHAHGDRRRAVVDGTRRSACSTVLAVVRRLDPVRGRVDADHRLARAGRAAARRGERARRRRSRASSPSRSGCAGIGVAWWIYSARRVPAPKPSARARAQVLLRRALRPALLLAGGRARAASSAGRRGPAHRRLDPRPHRPARARRRARPPSSRPASSAPTPSRSPPASPSSSSSSSR